MQPYKSEARPYSSGNRIQFNDFVPLRGPNGGRNVIAGFMLVFDGTATTVGAATLGEDRCRIFGRIQVHERNGLIRWNLLGDQSRVMCHLLDGAENVEEPIDSAVGAATVMDCEQYIPMNKRYTRRPKDFGLPVDDFKSVELICPANTEFALGGATITDGTIAGSYWVIALCYEEHNLEAKLKDEVGAVDFTSTTEVRISLRGKLTDLALHARGAAGGGAMANMPSVRIDELGMSVLTRLNDLLPLYKIRRGQADGLQSTQGSPMRTDPFTADVAVAVLMSDPADSNVGGKLLDSVKVTCDSNTVASVVALYRQVVPQSANYLAELSARWGVDPAGWQVKTEGKTKRSPRDWHPSQLPFLPKSNKLPKAA